LPKIFVSGNVLQWLRFVVRPTTGMMVPRLLNYLYCEDLAIWLELSKEQQSDYKLAKEKVTEKLALLKFEALHK